jgi:S1-C subfamily serine protease
MFFKELGSIVVSIVMSVTSWLYSPTDTLIAVPADPPVTRTVTSQQKASTTTQKKAQIATTSPTTPSKPAKVVSAPQTKQTSVPTSTHTKKPTITPSTIDFEAINQKSRRAIVNILCTTGTTNLSPITGTGIIIDPKGIILTNAHIGQYWLFQEKFKDADCEIRTGSPAKTAYKARLLYISPRWVSENRSLLDQESPMGTGENDYALLYINQATNNTSLPSSFEVITPNVREIINEGEYVLLSSYPAGFLGSFSIVNELAISSSITTIQKIFTFSGQTIDLVSVGGTIVSQKGSSGGAVVDTKGTLIGLISTASDAVSTKDRDLRAITLAHINRSLLTEIGSSLPELLSDDSKTFADAFNSLISPTLRDIILNALKKPL